MSTRTTTSRHLALAFSAALLAFASRGNPQDAGARPGPSGDFRSGVALTPRAAEPKTFHIYYLGGQSNMDGFGTVGELPADLNAPVAGIYIYHGNSAADGAPPETNPGAETNPDANPGASPGAGAGM